MTGTSVLAIIDSAPVFVDVVADPGAIEQAIRAFGRAELDDALAIVRAAAGEARGLPGVLGRQHLGDSAAG